MTNSLLKVLFLLQITVLFLSCSGDKNDPLPVQDSKDFTSIEIRSNPAVLSYALGEQLNLTGLSVYGKYSDGTIAELPVKVADVSGFDSSKAADKQLLTLSQNGCTATFTVRILPVRVVDGTITEVVWGGSTQLELPGSVRHIPAKQFKNSALERIILNEGLSSIGEEAFACSQLTSVVLPTSVTSLGKHAFMDCDKLTEVDLSKTQLATIEEGMFQQAGITSVKFPQGLTAIGEQAFILTSKLKELTIPEGVTQIGREAFIKSGVQTLRWANTVAFVGSRAFYQCNSLEKVTTYGDAVSSGIADSSIGVSSFEHCPSLVVFEIPKSVKRLRQNMLGNTSQIETLTLNSQIETIDFNAMGNASLKTVIVERDAPAAADFYIFPEKIESIKVPAGKAATYAAAKGWSEFKNKIKE